jgi:hypothetical protein
MNVLVDTSVWSAALRRGKSADPSVVMALQNLIFDHKVEIMGPIRQELLSGIREQAQVKKLEKHLAAFPDLEIETADYVLAATFFNVCRAHGVQGSSTDFLICAVGVRRQLSIYTVDKDFLNFEKYLPIVLHKSP